MTYVVADVTVSAHCNLSVPSSQLISVEYLPMMSLVRVHWNHVNLYFYSILFLLSLPVSEHIYLNFSSHSPFLLGFFSVIQQASSLWMWWR